MIKGVILDQGVLTSVGSILKQVYWRCTFEHLLISPHSRLPGDCIQVFVMRFGRMHPGKDFHQRQKYNFLWTVQYHKRFGKLQPYEVTIFDNAEVGPFLQVRERLVFGRMLWALHRLMILNQSVRNNYFRTSSLLSFCSNFQYFSGNTQFSPFLPEEFRSENRGTRLRALVSKLLIIFTRMRP